METAQAIILQIWKTNERIEGNTAVGLLLEIRPPNRHAYQASITALTYDHHGFQTGQIIEIEIDPNNPTQVTLAKRS